MSPCPSSFCFGQLIAKGFVVFFFFPEVALVSFSECFCSYPNGLLDQQPCPALVDGASLLRLSLSDSACPPWKHPPRHTQRFTSFLVLKPFKLAIKINHPTLINLHDGQQIFRGIFNSVILPSLWSCWTVFSSSDFFHQHNQ